MTTTNENLSELACLEQVARIGELPEGCSTSRYEGLGYVESRHGVLALTEKGRQRCAELQATEGHAVAAMALEPPPIAA
jgi:hypothetical protein